MNKLMKGAVAGAAGIALLLGGAGTFAVWNATATVQSQVISSGNLALTANGDGQWSDSSGPIANIGAYRIVPGKTLTYTETLNILATGNGLTATLTNSGVTGTQGTTPISDLTTALKVEKVSGANLTVGGTNGSSIAVTDGGATPGVVKATITVTFPSTSSTGKGGSVTINAPTFTLQQTTTQA